MQHLWHISCMWSSSFSGAYIAHMSWKGLLAVDLMPCIPYHFWFEQKLPYNGQFQTRRSISCSSWTKLNTTSLSTQLAAFSSPKITKQTWSAPPLKLSAPWIFEVRFFEVTVTMLLSITRWLGLMHGFDLGYLLFGWIDDLVPAMKEGEAKLPVDISRLQLFAATQLLIQQNVGN